MNTKETIRTAEEKLQQAADEKYPIVSFEEFPNQSINVLFEGYNEYFQWFTQAKLSFIEGAKSDAAREYWEGQDESWPKTKEYILQPRTGTEHLETFKDLVNHELVVKIYDWFVENKIVIQKGKPLMKIIMEQLEKSLK